MKPTLPKNKGSRQGGQNGHKSHALQQVEVPEKNRVLAFAFNKEALFINNLAERETRPAEVKQEISNRFHTFKGTETYAIIVGGGLLPRHERTTSASELASTFKGLNFILV